MKKNGILNSKIAKVLADLRHTDQIVIGDLGLPVPDGIETIDLTLKVGTPSFMEVLNIIADEMMIEEITIADEIKSNNPAQLQKIQHLFEVIPTRFVSHKVFKQQMKQVKVVIRTGEDTPYSNIILQSAVLF